MPSSTGPGTRSGWDTASAARLSRLDKLLAAYDRRMDLESLRPDERAGARGSGGCELFTG